MVTIGYKDLTSGKMQIFFKNDSGNLFRQKRQDRIAEALKELEHTGNIAVYLVKGNKNRLLTVKGI